MIVPVILSGGSGTRLWPLSRKNRPKQFLALTGGETLFQQTMQRVSHMPDAGAPIVVCSDDHRFMVAEQLQELQVEGASILLEPVARNTAPAIALAALHAMATDPDALLLALPADHLIGDSRSFLDAVAKAVPFARDDLLVTFGIRPSGPETGFGYIRHGEACGAGGFKVAQFVEKPNVEMAERYVVSGEYEWNSGMFLFGARCFLDELDKHAPDVARAARATYATSSRDLDFVRLDADTMSTSPDISIDYAVMEKTDRAVVVPVDCNWSDIGSWSALWQASEKDADHNAFEGDVIAIRSSNSLVRTHDRHLVAVVGIDDLVVVTTPDATLVTTMAGTQDVKTVVDELKRAGRSEHLFHRKVYRPWGAYDSIDMGERFQVKRIVVRPGAALSLQMHHHRAEHWIVVSGTAEVTCNDKVFLLAENQSTYLPLGSTHRLRNPGKVPLELIEVQSGSYLGEDDIVRFEDVYGRS